MKFGPVLLDEAEGKVLGHNISGADGRGLFRKGRRLTAVDVRKLKALGRSQVYVAEMEKDDVSENDAALRVAESVKGPGINLSRAATGRVNLKAAQFGILNVNKESLVQLNSQPGITLATLPHASVVENGKMVGTVKIIPFAVAETAVSSIESLAAGTGKMMSVTTLQQRRVNVILSGSPYARERVLRGFDPPLRNRVEALGSIVESIEYLPLEEEADETALSAALLQRVQEGTDLIILAGETAIMDKADIAPRAVLRAGGEIACYGAPVDPGNLLMLAYLQGVPIMGAPGCVRSPKVNIVDLIMPRLLVGEVISPAEIVAMGHGGLLEDVPERPMPRSRLD